MMKAYEGDGRDLSTALDAVRVVRSQLAQKPMAKFALNQVVMLDGTQRCRVVGRSKPVGDDCWRYDVTGLAGTRIDINVEEGRLS